MKISNTRPRLRPYHYRNAFSNTAKVLGYFCNRAWQYMTKVRMEQGDKVADEYEEALKFLESIREECNQLAW